MGVYNKLDGQPIFGLATPPGRSALAVIRVSGPGCLALLAPLCPGHNPEQQSPSTLRRVRLVHPETGALLDDAMVAVFLAPRSYTGEDAAELYCHGSMAVVESVLGALRQAGMRPALGGEFTLRAFLNGKVDLTQAEAVHELVGARSREDQQGALHRLNGALFQRIDAWKKALVQFQAGLSVQLDYAEDEIDDVPLDLGVLEDIGRGLHALAASFDLGRRYQAGVRVALGGKTNAGKSSLFNLLVREDRAIVSEHHGTTRDYLEANLEIRGIPVRLFDTAGLRETLEAVEREGIRRSSEVLGAAAILVYVVDGARGFDDEDRRNLLPFLGEGRQGLVVWNKVDLLGPGASVPGTLALEGADGDLPVVGMSAAKGEGLEGLLETLSVLVRGDSQAADGMVVDSERQYRLLREGAEALDRAREAAQGGWAIDAVALEVRDALDALGQITGEVGSEDILDAVFSGFCLGK